MKEAAPMKKVLCLALVLMIVSVSLALAAVVDSPKNQDIADVEVVEVNYQEDDDEDDPAPAPAVDPAPANTPPPQQPGTEPNVKQEVIDIVTNPDQDNPEKDPPASPVVGIVEPPKAIETVIEDLKTTYEVTINYVSIDGTQVQEPVKEMVEAGQPINIAAVPIENFISAGAEQQIMPARDVELTVIYVPDDFAEEIISIKGYETPLGLGSTFMNVGVCVE